MEGIEEQIPLVSICCLTYNHASFISECLTGFVIQKTNFPFEILIHDDASTDGTAEIVREYEAKYPELIKPIYQTENQYSKGVKISPTYQYPRARGKYIALCEGDDFWTDPLKLQKQVDFLEDHPEYSMCFHNVEVVAEEGCRAETDIYDHLREGDYTGEEIITRWTVPTCSVLFRKSCIDRLPYHPDFKIGDNVLFLTCASCGKIFCMNEKMGVYRRNAGGWTTQSTQKVAKDFICHYEAMKICFPTVPSRIFDEKIVSFYGLLTLMQLCRFDPELWQTVRRGFKSYRFRYVASFIGWGCNKSRNMIRKKLRALTGQGGVRS